MDLDTRSAGFESREALRLGYFTRLIAVRCTRVVRKRGGGVAGVGPRSVCVRFGILYN